MSEISVHFLVQGHTDPAARFRALAYVPGLERLGFKVRCDELAAAGRERRRILESTAESEVVIVQRRLFNLRDQGYLRQHARCLIFDFDDAIMFKDSGSKSFTRSGRFSRVVRSANLVIAGNAYLASAARAYNQRVEVLPTVVDTEHFRPGPARADAVASDAGLVIGWIGSRSTLPYLIARAPELESAALALASAGVATRFEVVCDEFAGLPAQFGAAPVVQVPWSEDAELPALQRFDIGLMPLPDDPWTRGKCGFKLLQYLATETAAVADAVGVNADILAADEGGQEVGGILARAPDDWAPAIVALGTDRARRERAGRSGRARVQAGYSMSCALPRLALLIESARRSVGT